MKLKLGMKKVSVIALDVQEVTRLMIQQVMNKLEGSHDSVRDLDVFKLIKSDDKLPEEHGCSGQYSRGDTYREKIAVKGYTSRFV